MVMVQSQWRSINKELLKRIKVTERHRIYCILPIDNHEIWCAGDDTYIYIINSETFDIIEAINTSHRFEIRSMIINPLTNTVITASADRTIIEWDCVKREKKRSLELLKPIKCMVAFEDYILVGQNGSILFF